MRKVSICSSPCAEAKRLILAPCALRATKPCGHAEPHPRCRVVEKAPADRLASGSGRGRELLLLLRVEHPGCLAAIAALKRSHGRNRTRRHIAIGDTLIVPRPDQIGRKRDPLR